MGIKKQQEEVLVGSIHKSVKENEIKKSEDETKQKITTALTNAEKAMAEKNPENAKKEYQEAMQLYNGLSRKQQDLMYPELMKTYNKLI